MSKIVADCAKVYGSAKIAGHERGIEVLRLGEFSVTNNPLPSRADKREQGKNPGYGSIYYQAMWGGDSIETLNALGLGTNIGTFTFTVLQATGKNNIPEMVYTLGQLNGATYVRYWSMYYNDAAPPETGNKIIYTVELVTNGVEIQTNTVGQDQQAKGKVTAKLSRLNQQPEG